MPDFPLDERSASPHAKAVLAAVRSRKEIAPVVSSWRRCLVLHNLDPDDPRPPRRTGADSLEAAHRSSASLIQAAAPHLDHAASILAGTECSILLPDAEGLVVDARPSGSHDPRLRTTDRWTGIDLSERSEGTNAAGMCLVEQRPISIVADQHFYTRNIDMATSGVPIFDPVSGVAGAIDVSWPAVDGHPFLDKAIHLLVIEMARRTELMLFGRTFASARLVMVDRNGANGSAVLAVDSRDRVIGATHAARQLLKLTQERMSTPFPAEEIWPSDRVVTGSLQAIERQAIERAMAEHADNITAAARALGISRGTLHRKIAAWRS